jgi:hypothetical protein
MRALWHVYFEGQTEKRPFTDQLLPLHCTLHVPDIVSYVALNAALHSR